MASACTQNASPEPIKLSHDNLPLPGNRSLGKGNQAQDRAADMRMPENIRPGRIKPRIIPEKSIPTLP